MTQCVQMSNKNTPLHMAAQSDHTAKDYSVDIVKFEIHHDLMAKTK